MSHHCWTFVLLVLVVVTLSDARPHKCEQREPSLVDLDLAEDALNKAKQLVLEEENESSNSSECSKKDKSLGFIDVALDLVSNAKKNIPICPHVPTEEPCTEEPTPDVTAEEPTPDVTAEEPTPEVTAENSTPEVTTEGGLPMDCQELQSAGHVTSGVYTVWPRGKSVQVRCDMETDGGGWTVIHRRGNFSKKEVFDREWNNYKNGFGSLQEEFWVGNDHIYSLSNQGDYSLRMDMTAADGDSAYALYREFRIEDENANYKLHVDHYEGTAGNSMAYSNDQMFYTKDSKKDKNPSGNCPEERKGAFWYGVFCSSCNPNGLYQPGEEGVASMHYSKFKGSIGLLSMEMKMKRL